VDPPELELELELETPPRPCTVPQSNVGALVHGHRHGTLVAPAALLRIVHAILPLYAVVIRLAQFAFWRRRP